MAYSPDFRAYPRASAATTAAVLDAGLRAYMLRVYNWMASGLLLTGIVALLVVTVPAVQELFYTTVRTPYGLARQPKILFWIAALSPLAFTLVLSFGYNRLSKGTAQALFWAFCACMGASLS